MTITNTGDEEVDLTGYQINFEAGEDSNVNQIRELSGEVLIPAGEDIVVSTGINKISGDNIVELVDPYQTEVLNNENPDVVALLDPDGNVVASTGETGSSDPAPAPTRMTTPVTTAIVVTKTRANPVIQVMRTKPMEAVPVMTAMR